MNKIMKKGITFLATTALMVSMLSIAVLAEQKVEEPLLNRKICITNYASYQSKDVYFCKRVSHTHNLSVSTIGKTGALKDSYMRKGTSGVYTCACTYSRNVVKSNASVTYGYTVGPVNQGDYAVQLWTHDCVIYPTKLTDTYYH